MISEEDKINLNGSKGQFGPGKQQSLGSGFLPLSPCPVFSLLNSLIWPLHLQYQDSAKMNAKSMANLQMASKSQPTINNPLK